MSIDFAAIAAAAAETEDFTKEQAGGDFERVLPEAGKALCRFREYIELGTQETKSQTYPNKKPARKAKFVFELVTPKHIQVFKEGEEGEFKRPHIISIEVVLSKSSKSNFIKLFKQLNYKQDAVHPAQLLGNGYLCEIVHAWKKGDDPKKDKPTYANLQKDGVYTFSAPRIEDPLAGTAQDITVPDLFDGQASRKIFLFDHPTKDTWDSLFIDGTYERDGKEYSKNFIQNRILEAHDYPGSELEAILNSDDGEGLGELPTEAAETAAPTDVDDPLAGIA